jgi:hypothetical protein
VISNGREPIRFIYTFYHVKCALLYIENDAAIFPVHYTWKVAEKMAFIINKLAIINSSEIILEK